MHSRDIDRNYGSAHNDIYTLFHNLTSHTSILVRTCLRDNQIIANNSCICAVHETFSSLKLDFDFCIELISQNDIKLIPVLHYWLMSTGSEVEWAECSLIIGTGCRVQFLAWSSPAQLVCQRAFSLLAIWCLIPWVGIMHSAEEDSLSNIACLCQSTEINTKKTYWLILYGKKQLLCCCYFA